MYSVNMNDNKMNVYNNKQHSSGNDLKKGDIIQGVIVGFKDSNALIEIADKTIETNKANISGNVGDKIDFEIISNKDGVQLRQLSKKEYALIEQNEKAKYNKNLLDKDDRNALDIEEKTTLQKEVERKIELANLKRKMKSDHNKFDENIVKKLVAEGIDIGEISITAMNSIEADIQQDISKMPKSKVKEILGKNRVSKSDYDKIANEFKNNGLEFNNSNVMKVNNALQKFNNIIENIDNVNTSYAIRDGRELTINNLYASRGVPNQKNIDEGMTEQIKQFLSKNNIEVTEQNINSSLHLLSNEKEINADNIKKINFVNNELKNIDEAKLISNFVRALQNGNRPENINLTGLTDNVKQIHSTNMNILNEISNVDDKTLAFMQENDVQFTLSNIVENKNSNSSSNALLNDGTLVAKRRMLEIQLKLTSDVSFSLANKGIEIDIMPLQEALNEIKKIENATYVNSLQRDGAIFSQQNVNNISGVFDKLQLFNETTNITYKKIINNEIQFNIDEISKEIISTRMAKNYEANQTVINPKFKDTFDKVKEQIAPLLEKLNIESNDMNVKASSILVKNKMDITQENIDNVLLVDTKMNELKSELQPNIVLKMLKEGINPLTTNIDDVLEYANNYYNENGIKNSHNENIIKNLIRLEKDKSVSESQLQTVKSVYRAISQSVKNDIGVGALVNSEHDLTIANLLNNANYMEKGTGDNYYLDEALSDTENANTEKLYIKQQPKSQLNGFLLNNIVKNNDINFIKQLANEDSTLKSLFNENGLVKDEISNEEIGQQLNRIENTNNEKVHDYLIKNNITPTIANMEIVKDILKNEFNQTTRLKNCVDKNEKIKEKLYNIENDNLEEVITEDSILPNILNELHTELDDIISDMQSSDEKIDAKKLSMQQHLIQSMKFQDEFNKSNQSEYELPVLLPLSSEATNLKMFLPNKNALNNNESLIVFSLSTENLGDLTITANYDEKAKNVKISFDNENQKALQKLNQDKQYLIDNLKNLGIENVIFETI